MLTSQKYQNKKIAIYGMGITGLSAAKTLKKLGAQVLCWDDNQKIRKSGNQEFWKSEKHIIRNSGNQGIRQSVTQ